MTKSIWLALLAIGLLPAGCGRSGGSDIVKAGGTIIYHQEPLANVNVTFLPERGRPASGTTDAQGRFGLSTLQSGDGAVIGRHKVSIAAPLAGPMPGSREAKTAARSSTPFPAKYSNPDSSGLTATVEAGSPNEFHFDLAD